MKNTLWIIIAVVTGIVGFLVGYSVSGFTASRRAEAAARAPVHEGSGAGGYAGAPAHKAEAGGYGGAAPAPKTEAGGYGGPAAQPPAQKVAEKPKAAGY